MKTFRSIHWVVAIINLTAGIFSLMGMTPGLQFPGLQEGLQTGLMCTGIGLAMMLLLWLEPKLKSTDGR